MASEDEASERQQQEDEERYIVAASASAGGSSRCSSRSCCDRVYVSGKESFSSSSYLDEASRFERSPQGDDDDDIGG